MYSWPRPHIPMVAGSPDELCLYDTADRVVKPVVGDANNTVGMYVCGITPYDSTHLGHAATYVAFDLIHRQLLDQGLDVRFIENVTDVDDPLFERAERDQVDWRELGAEQVELFRSDMTALKIIPPSDFVAVTSIVDEVKSMVAQLLATGDAYVIDTEAEGTGDQCADIYAPVSAVKNFGYVSNLTTAEMLPLFAERGGDPDRPGKKNKLDALLWRAARPGEPRWEAPFGAGRPGWHIECAAIAWNRLGGHFAIQGGGKDLAFPHHEFTAAHVQAAASTSRMAEHYVHTGMIGLDGVKMSKSLGNLVFVSGLRSQGVDPSAIRLVLYAGHYRSDRDFTPAGVTEATARLTRWAQAVAREHDKSRAQRLVAAIRRALSNDLDTPAALAAIDQWADDVPNSHDTATNSQLTEAGFLIVDALESLMGISLPVDRVEVVRRRINTWLSDVLLFVTGGYLQDSEKEFWLAPCDESAVTELSLVLNQLVDDLVAVGPGGTREDFQRVIDKALADIDAINRGQDMALIEQEEAEELAALLILAATTAGCDPADARQLRVNPRGNHDADDDHQPLAFTTADPASLTALTGSDDPRDHEALLAHLAELAEKRLSDDTIDNGRHPAG